MQILPDPRHVMYYQSFVRFSTPVPSPSLGRLPCPALVAWRSPTPAFLHTYHSLETKNLIFPHTTHVPFPAACPPSRPAFCRSSAALGSPHRRVILSSCPQPAPTFFGTRKKVKKKSKGRRLAAHTSVFVIIKNLRRVKILRHLIQHRHHHRHHHRSPFDIATSTNDVSPRPHLHHAPADHENNICTILITNMSFSAIASCLENMSNHTRMIQKKVEKRPSASREPAPMV